MLVVLSLTFLAWLSQLDCSSSRKWTLYHTGLPGAGVIRDKEEGAQGFVFSAKGLDVHLLS